MKKHYVLFKVIFFVAAMLIAFGDNAISCGIVISSAEEVVCALKVDETNSCLPSDKKEGTSSNTTSVQENPNITLAPLSFNAVSPVYAKPPGGLGTIRINAQGGTPPYVYYLIPETQWLAGDQMYNKLLNSDTSLLPDYKYTQNTMDVAAGTNALPKYYWVAVDDAVNSAKFILRGTNLLSWWKRIAVKPSYRLFLTQIRR